MLSPLIRCAGRDVQSRERERGFTMAFVALTMAVLISMAALSIDVATLYQAKAEAQRAADAAALTAARFISISGITGATSATWGQICGGTPSPATQAAISMAQQNLIGGVAVPSASVQVNYIAGKSGAGNADCSMLGPDFGVNPIVTVSVQRTNLPVFFAHIFSLFGSTFASPSVSATATAEAYNPSGAIPLVPLHPRCVKPWFVPNLDPGSPGNPFVTATTGQLNTPGISPAGPIDETFNLAADCVTGGAVCTAPSAPTATGGAIQYLPGQVSNPSIAVADNGAIPACSTFNTYSQAVAGCDQSTIYACGDSLANKVDLSEDPGPPANDSVNAAECLINANGNGLAQGQDNLAPPGPPAPTYTYPFQIQPGGNSALVSAGISGINSSSQITSSPSIVSLPIYDNGAVSTFTAGAVTQVTVIGFLQVFINSVTGNATTGTINVTVMNVAGCGNSFGNLPPFAFGTSPVPIRLITPP